MSTCKKCNHEVQGNYCSNCGHPQKVERINGRYILHELSHVFNFEKGIFLLKDCWHTFLECSQR